MPVQVAGGIPGVPGIGAKYWHDPGAFPHGFRGMASVFVFTSTFYAGCESIAVAATETKNPRTAVPLAIRQVFWRIIFIYMGSAIFFGLTCPSNADGKFRQDPPKNPSIWQVLTSAPQSQASSMAAAALSRAQ